jgi:hypothetical protein
MWTLCKLQQRKLFFVFRQCTRDVRALQRVIIAKTSVAAVKIVSNVLCMPIRLRVTLACDNTCRLIAVNHATKCYQAIRVRNT